MENAIIYELIGYVASVLVAISLMMSNIVRLRVVNLIGAATFSLYGMLIGSVPVAAMNGFIVLINMYYLWKIYTSDEYFKILKISPENEYLRTFLDFYKEQIKKYQPGFSSSFNGTDMNLFVLRNMVPAGLLIGELEEDGRLHVKLDFVVPQYRDFKIGEYLFRDKLDYFRKKGVKEIISDAGSKQHNRYLEEMGFKKKEDSGIYQLTV